MTCARGGSGVAASSGGSSGGGPTAAEQLVHALRGARARRARRPRRRSSSTEIRSSQLLVELVRETAQRAARPRLDRAERDVRGSRRSRSARGRSSTRARSSERSCSGSVSSARCTRHASQSASTASSGPGPRRDDLGRVVDRRLAGCVAGRRRSRSGRPCRATTPPARARGRSARRAPHAGERVLRHVLGSPAVAESPERDPEHGARVAAVELLEREAIAACRRAGGAPRPCASPRSRRERSRATAGGPAEAER